MIVKTVLISLSAYLLAILLTPIIKKIAIKYKIIDHPNERKVHKNPIPKLGGIGIFLAATFSYLLWTSQNDFNKNILTGAILILIIGIIDDIVDLKPWTKLIGQALIAVLTYKMGIQINIISSPLGGNIPTMWLSLPITVFWILTIINAINLIDGIDGLATGITTIASFILTIIALSTSQYTAACLSASICGASLGFLKYNFFPAKIFMGDSGAMFLGYMLATISITGVLKSPLTFAVLLPILILAIPLIDTTLSIIRRIKNKKNIFKADKKHLHHLLLTKGYSVKEISYGGYLISTSLGLLALTIGFFKGFYALLSYSLVTGITASIIIYICLKQKNN